MAEKITMDTGEDVKAVERLQDARNRIHEEIGKVIVGQREIIDQLIIAFFPGATAC